MGEAMIHLPARVSPSVVSNNDEEQVLEKINRQTLEPIRSMDDVFCFSAIVSNDQLDSHMTKMDASTTLRNYTDNLQSGVALLSGHDISKAPYGRSYDGEIVQGYQINDPTSVRAHWYILRDTLINGEPTNDTIRAIKAGIIKDMSVGFKDGWYRCSSCGKDLFDSSCSHFPGLRDEDGNTTYAWIVDASLREVSTVYKGSTPGAYIEKAREYYEQGQLPHEHIARLENAYSIRLDEGGRSFYMPQKDSQKEERQMGEQFARNNLVDDIRQAIRENRVEKAVIYDVLAETGDPFRQPEDIELRNELGKDYSNPLAVRQLKKEAQQGRRYLEDVIDQAVKSRIRAQGEHFNADSYRQMLNLSGDIDHIKEEIASYERLAKEKWNSGRQTTPPKDEHDEHEESGSDENRETNYDAGNFFDEGGEE